MSSPLPEDAQKRKEYPMYRGLLCYFPKALAAVANRSYEGGKQHGHDELHWDRNKSSDDADAAMRHMTEGDWVGFAWRALACLEKHLEGQDLSVLNQPAKEPDERFNSGTGVEPPRWVETESEWGEWIDWDGGECPIIGRKEVQVESREGSVVATETPYNEYWRHDDMPYDIIRYRVKKG